MSENVFTSQFGYSGGALRRVFDATKTFVMPSDPLTLISQQIVRDSVDGIQDLAVYSWDEVLRQSESGGIVKASSTGYYYGIHCRSFSHFRPRKNNPSALVGLKLTLNSLTAEFVNCNSLTQFRVLNCGLCLVHVLPFL